MLVQRAHKPADCLQLHSYSHSLHLQLVNRAGWMDMHCWFTDK
jgi:hypothetical protein